MKALAPRMKYLPGGQGPYRNALPRGHNHQDVSRKFSPGVAGKGNWPPGTPGFSLDVLGDCVDQKYLCRICGLLLRQPLQGDCGHRFCRGCIPVLEEQEDGGPALCPACETEGEETRLTPDDVYPDKAIQRDMMDLPATCVNDSCTWSGDFSNYVTHEGTCERRQVTCECGETVVAVRMSKHVASECQLREISCVFCHQKIQARHMGDHNTECNLYPVECPECSQKVPRVNMEVHLDPMRGDCRMSKCRYGCDSLNTREHEQECMAKHLRITFERLLQLEERLKEKEEMEVVTMATMRKDAEEEVMERESFPASNALSAAAQPFFPAASPAPVTPVTGAGDEYRVGGFAGVLEWTIRDFNMKRQIAMEELDSRAIYSPVFYKGRNGYRLCACVYINGDGMGKGRYLSFFIAINQGQHDAELPWPFMHQVTLMLLDQSGEENHITHTFQPDPTSDSYQKPSTTRNTPSGCPLFCPVEKLIGDDSPYVQYDAIRLKVIVQ